MQMKRSHRREGRPRCFTLFVHHLYHYHYHYHHFYYYYKAVREESAGEDPEGAPEDGCAEGPGADVEVRVVVLEEVAGVVRPAVASRVAEEG